MPWLELALLEAVYLLVFGALLALPVAGVFLWIARGPRREVVGMSGITWRSAASSFRRRVQPRSLRFHDEDHLGPIWGISFSFT
jgi:cytochrome b561